MTYRLVLVVTLLSLVLATRADDDHESAGAGCVCEIQKSRSKRAAWGINYAGARIDAQEMRIAQLSRNIDELETRIGDDHDHDYHNVVNELERRLEQIEGTDCNENEFSCGRKTGQCINDLQVCDHTNDCSNGHDEDEAHVCVNQVPAGRSWTGRVNWSSCMNRQNNQLSILITGNRRMKHFPSRIWVDAVLVEKWIEDKNEHTRTWNTRGYFDYARSRVVLDAPEGSKKMIGVQCDDAGEGLTDCKLVRATDGHICGHGVLVRAVHH